MTEPLPKRNHKRLLVALVALVFAMCGFAYALVPLYNVLCKQWGINGKTGGRVLYDTTHAIVDKSRWVTIEFTTSTNQNLPWKFYSLLPSIKIHPGEMRLVQFYAENNSGRRMTVQAIPSVAPGLAARYLKKTECFCFTQQTFDKGEGEKMPVLFHIDSEIPKNIHTISLSYTLFDATGIKPKNSNTGQIT